MNYEITDESKDYQTNVKKSHAAEAIKSRKDINKITKYLEESHRYRDLLLFIMGINFGLRCGDLVSLRIGDVIDDKGNILKTFRIIEDKTEKIRTMAMNESVVYALKLYLEDKFHGEPVDRNNYLFTSKSNNKSLFADNQPLAVFSVERLLKEIVNDECGIEVHASTHMLRKTFAYHFLMSAPDRSRALELLSYQMNHSSLVYTLRYIGITQSEILDTCFGLNLGWDAEGDNITSETNNIGTPVNVVNEGSAETSTNNVISFTGAKLALANTKTSMDDRIMQG